MDPVATPEGPHDEVLVIADGDGLAVFGEPSHVEHYLRRADLWETSQPVDLHRRAPLLDLISAGTELASLLTSQSSRWVKLTEESAALMRDKGLMPTAQPGIDHLIIGKPGQVSNWLQREVGVAAQLNPDTLHALSTALFRASRQQEMSQIRDFLERIDVRIGELLTKVDDAALSSLGGVRRQLGLCQRLLEHEGRVDDDHWGVLQSSIGELGKVEEYASRQLRTAVLRVDGKKLAPFPSEEQATTEARKWVGVIAECFRLRSCVDEISLSRVEHDPDLCARRRAALVHDRAHRLSEAAELIGSVTRDLDDAVSTANERLLWRRGQSLTAITIASSQADLLHHFRRALDMPSAQRSYEARKLGKLKDFGSRGIQTSRDAAPVVGKALAATTAVAAGATAVRKHLSDDDSGDQ